MPLGHLGIEWLNLNGQRSFPLADFATKRDVTGTFALPDSFLVSLYFPAHAGLDVDPTRFFIRRVSAFPAGYSVSLGYDDGTDDPPVVATAIVARNGHTENRSYALPGAGDFDDSVGKLVVGRLDEIDLQPAGDFVFDRAGGALDTDCIRPIIRGVSSLAIASGGVRSRRLYGDVELVAGTNMRLVVAGQTIRLDAVTGEGLIEECACDGGRDKPGPIRTINGIPPRPSGDFTFEGNACIEVAAAGGGLAFSDTCAQPCCGCEELEKLVEELDHFGTEATTLRNYVTRLQAQVDTMELTVLGSRLADAPCAEEV